MDALLEAIQDVVPEVEAQPDAAQPIDANIETQLANQISSLWTENSRLTADRRTTAVELRQIRAALAERLHEMKSLLSRPGRGGLWRSWLKEKGINRSTADRLCDRHGETLGIENGNVPSGAISNSQDDSAEKVAKSVWQRFRNTLATDDVVIDFIDRVAELAGLGHEQRADGLLIFTSSPKTPVGSPDSVPAIDPASQHLDEVAIVEEPRDETAADSTEVGAAVAAVGTSDGDVA